MLVETISKHRGQIMRVQQVFVTDMKQQVAKLISIHQGLLAKKFLQSFTKPAALLLLPNSTLNDRNVVFVIGFDVVDQPGA